MLFNNLRKKLIYIKTPSKYNPGCSNLWRGLPFSILNKIIIKSIQEFKKRIYNNTSYKRDFLFRSARAGIYSILKSRSVGEGDQVIVSAFTCNAVTFAINSTNAKIVYTDINHDLSMNYNSIIENINNNTKAILIQNSFGNKGLNKKEFDKLKAKGLLLIEDNCLSIGTQINEEELNINGDFSVESLESSKSLTLGRGGIVKCNSIKNFRAFDKFYDSLKRENLISDILKIIQLWVNIFFTKYPIKYGFIIWYLLYGTRLFKTSKSENKYVNNKFVRMGKFSEKIYFNLIPYKKNIFLNSNHVFNVILYELKKNKAKILIEYKQKDFIITPRIPILVPKLNLDKILDIAKENKIEISRWFCEIPPSLNLRFNVDKSSNTNTYIKNQIINIPSYCTNKQELQRINYFIKLIAPHI